MSSRLALVAATILTFGLSWAPLPSSAEDQRHHALSLVGKPKYGPDFKHFGWVNPEAPKGGDIRMFAQGTFDSLNPYPVKGNAATGLSLIYDQLMEDSAHEPSTEYALLAEWASYPDDYSSVTFQLREGARFSDGEPVKPEDVVFTLGELKRVSPAYRFYYKNVVKAEKTGERQVTFRFDVKGNRELPQIVGQLPILPKHYWTANDKDGNPRDLGKSTLEVPIGSGPYRIKEVKAGRNIVYERRDDYWAKDLPINVGMWNFDTLRFEYFRDAQIGFEAFKAGRLDFFNENLSKRWATGYDFKAVEKGWVVKRQIDLKRGAPMQGFVFNTRRKKFSDPRVRRAFNLAFDFEWANKNLFYGQYIRTASYFANMELASEGLPKGRELEILEEVRNKVPPEVFTTPYTNPKNDTPRAHRQQLRKAIKLLKEAGWNNKNGVLTNAETGETMTVQILLVSPAFQRIVQPYAQSLGRLGIKVSIRLVDSSQYESRLENFDFDMIVGTFAQSESPGNEQRNFWGTESADRKGSRNFIGIKNPAIDKIIDKVIFAKSRADLVAATKALDRVLLWNHYIVPQWHVPYARVAYWDKLRRPEPGPSQSVAFVQTWWYDKEAAKRLAEVN